jgi:hypothetical protein
MYDYSVFRIMELRERKTVSGGCQENLIVAEIGIMRGALPTTDHSGVGMASDSTGIAARLRTVRGRLSPSSFF